MYRKSCSKTRRMVYVSLAIVVVTAMMLLAFTLPNSGDVDAVEPKYKDIEHNGAKYDLYEVGGNRYAHLMDGKAIVVDFVMRGSATGTFEIVEDLDESSHGPQEKMPVAMVAAAAVGLVALVGSDTSYS